MPYSRESKEKHTLASESEQDNASQEFQWSSQAGATLSDERINLSAGSNNDRLFAFIREHHLEEAQEFRLKGYNSQVPEVDGGLLTQLRNDLAATKSRLCLQKSVRGPLGSRWLLGEINHIEHLTSSLSDDVIKPWVEREVPRKDDGETMGSRRLAQSLARRLEATLQTLIKVVHTLRAIDDYSTPEKRHDMLVAELAGVFSFCDKSAVVQALGSMTAKTSGHAAWVSLMQARAAAWEAGKLCYINGMIEAWRHEAEKAAKKARQLRGDPRTFFSRVADCLQDLSSYLEKVSIHAGLSTASPAIPQVNNNEDAGFFSRFNSLWASIKPDYDKIKTQVKTTSAVIEKQMHRLARVTKHRHLTATPAKSPEHVVADSLIRSILWQWQQPAIKIQYASAALLSKVDELKKIEEILTPNAAADGRECGQEHRNTPVSSSGEENLVAQVREWVNDSLEQENPENQQAAKAATLERLLGGDIDHAQSLLARLGSTTDSIQKVFERQLMSVSDMLKAGLPADISRSLREKIKCLVDKVMPDMARELAVAVQALNAAALAAGNSARNFPEARDQAHKAQLLATEVKECLSTASALLTERPLDEHSRGTRLARHWANLAKEHNAGNYSPPDAQQVLASLKKLGLLEGILSTGDPEGYLFATRLAGELENARNNELRLPMSPEQYAALEKELVEYIVKSGQRQISRGGARIVIELSFGLAADVALSFLRLPYKVLKASIKIPYDVNKVNHYIMPGHDKPYKAIYGLLEKKLKQLGFNLVTAPAPGVLKFAAGVAVTSGTALHNSHVEKRENTFSAVYQRVAEGKQSEKVNMRSVKGMVIDSALDIPVMAASKGIQMAWRSGRNENNIISEQSFKNEKEPLDGIDEETLQEPGNGMEAEERAMVQGSGRQAQARRQAVSEGNDNANHRARRSVFDSEKNNPEDLYNKLTKKQKINVYSRKINERLKAIVNDGHIPDNLRLIASEGLAGKACLIPVDIHSARFINVFFIPSDPGSKWGIMVDMNDDSNPYKYITKKEDVPSSYFDKASGSRFYRNYFTNEFVPGDGKIFNPIGAVQWERIDRGEFIGYLKNGGWNFSKDFMELQPELMNVNKLSKLLVSDYKTREAFFCKETNFHIGFNKQSGVFDGINDDVYVGVPIPEMREEGSEREVSESSAILRDLVPGTKYYTLPESAQRLIYIQGIFVSVKNIQKDIESGVMYVPDSKKSVCLENLKKVLAGEEISRSFEISGRIFINTFFIPNEPGAQQGILVNLNGGDKPYVYVDKKGDIPGYYYRNVIAGDRREVIYHTGRLRTPINLKAQDWAEQLRLMRHKWSYSKHFNTQNTSAMNEDDLAKQLMKDINKKYRTYPNADHNQNLVKLANITNYHDRPVETSVRYEIDWDLNLKKFLETYHSPGAVGAPEVAKLVSMINGDRYDQAMQRQKNVELIGAFADFTQKLIVGSIPGGQAIVMSQSAAGLGAKMLGDDGIGAEDLQDILDRPNAPRLNAQHLATSKPNMKVKQGPPASHTPLLSSKKGQNNKASDKASGISPVKATFDPALTKPRGLKNSGPVNYYNFRVNGTNMLGRIQGNNFAVSRNGGKTWQEGSELQRNIMRLQNAGGSRLLPEKPGPSFEGRDRPRAETPKASRWQGKLSREEIPNMKSMPFKFNNKNFHGRFNDGKFQYSTDEGTTWKDSKIINGKKEVSWYNQNKDAIDNTVKNAQDNINKRKPQNREPVLERNQLNALSPVESNAISNVKAKLQTELGSEYNKFISLPKENCANAAEEVKKVLTKAGYNDVHVIELGIWINGREARVPVNHYVVSAKKNGTEIIVDLTAGQFDEYGFSDPIIDSKNNWISRWQNNMETHPNHLVKIVPAPSGALKGSFFSFYNNTYLDAWKTVPNSKLIQSPAWYNNI